MKPPGHNLLEHAVQSHIFVNRLIRDQIRGPVQDGATIRGQGIGVVRDFTGGRARIKWQKINADGYLKIGILEALPEAKSQRSINVRE